MTPAEPPQATVLTPIRPAAFLVADEVRADDDGLYVRGGFRPMATFDSYPVDAQIPLVVVMEYPPKDEVVIAELEVDLYNQSGDVVEHAYSPLRLERRHPEHPLGLPSYMVMPVLLTPKLPEPGTYRIALSVNGEPDVAEYMFHARLPQPPSS